MPNDIDKSLLDRLQALRGSSPNVTPEQAAPVKFSVDTIERSKTPTREDALVSRLKSLRAQDETSPASTRALPTQEKKKTDPSLTHSESISEKKDVTSDMEKTAYAEEGDDVDAMFSTDDKTLEELLGGVGEDENPPEEPSDDQIKALLEEISKSIPKDTAEGGNPSAEDEKATEDSDDSDGEHMQRDVDDVIAKFRDEAEVEAALNPKADVEPDNEQDNEDGQPTDLALPTLPPNLDDLPSSPPRTTSNAKADDIDDITARMAALRAPTANTDSEDSLNLPSVPSFKPSTGDTPVKRLTSKTNYTDDDMDGWCTVCLEDATVQCLGCDDDVYCTRCWREMHIGPSAGFDERSHKAVHFTRAKKREKKVALGA